MLLRARLVVPGRRRPIDNGAVALADGRIAAVGRWPDLARAFAGQPCDLGEVLLLPGLVNAHCHLDYTDMAGLLPPPKSFTDWIKAITALKAQWSYTEFARSWLNGARMLLAGGVTTVGDVEAAPELLPEVWEATPLRVFSFLEMTGIKSRRQPDLILKEAATRIASLAHGRCRAGLSPHAAYSTTPQLLRLSARLAREQGWRLVTHVAESSEEFDMFVHARGAMFDWLKRNQRDQTDCGWGSPVQHFERHEFLDANVAAVHANYLAPGDAELLARRGVSVVHCPRSHAYFGHAAFPFHELARAGVNVALGTDSLATTLKPRGAPLELDLFAEMRAFARTFPDVPPEGILRLATVNAAAALGGTGQVGELAAGAFADLITVPFDGPLADAVEFLVRGSGRVSRVMIGGQWALPDSTRN